MKIFSKRAFTIIELLTVIAVIAILSSILIPVTGGIMRQSRIAASKAQLWQYVNAIENFKAEYNYYPTIFGTSEVNYPMEGALNSINFIEALSGRDVASGNTKSVGGNYRSIQFHSFSDSECFVNAAGVVQQHRLADRFNNNLIRFRLDMNGDGFVNPSTFGNRDPQEPDNPLRTSITAWVLEDPDNGFPGYALWE